MDTIIPLKLDPLKSIEPDDRRLWIGNLDPRVNEYQLLKLVRNFGEIEKFDLMFHRTGPLAGQPRGFAFVTFKKRIEALRAQEALHGKTVGLRTLSVKWAQTSSNDDVVKPKPELEITALAGVTKSDTKISKKTAIQSIEAKLKLMESKEAGDDFIINKLAASEAPVLAQFQQKQISALKQDKNSRRRKYPYHHRR